ncbi:calcium/sodium antiporter [uncultured Maritalea sp.]|uniref:calcium/sodium antiporter n=1 Tax=uncultured Maritalea sp. TaxID=757249 RepID=UPI002603E3C2|nr:calcium/sodium antiporter [uncultured Maritalea sp.]
MALTLLYLFAGLILLFVGGESLVRGSAALAVRLRVPAFVVGLTIVGFGTSMPELLVSLSAALKGAPDIAMGNVVGSNIANILLILGVSALLLPLKQEFSKSARDIGVMVFAGLLLVGLSAIGIIERWAGLLMVGSLATYVIYILFFAKQGTEAQVELPISSNGLLKEIAFVAIGLVSLVIGAEWLVDASTTIARSFEIPEAVIGLTIVAVGTSLPELATSVMAALKRESDIAVGNILGSNIFNILGILGVTAIITPIAISPTMATFDIPVMIAVFFSLALLIFFLGRISRIAGISALTLYAGYVAYLY